MQASLPLRASRALLPGASSASAFAARGSFAATQPVQNAEAMRSGFRALSAGAARGFAPGASPAAQNAQQSGRVMTGARPVYESSGGAMHSVRADARAYSSHPRVAAPGTHGGSSGGGAQGSMPSMTLSAAGLLAGALVWSSHRTADADAAGGMDAKSVGQALASSDGAEVRKGAAAAQGVEAAAAVRMLVKKEVLFHVDPSVREAALESLITAFAAALESLVADFMDPLGAEEGATAGALKELALLAAASKAYPKVVAMAAAALAALAEGTSGAGSLPPLAPAEAVAIVSLLSAGGDAGGAQKDAARAVAALGADGKGVVALLQAGAVGALAGALVEGAAPVDVQVVAPLVLSSTMHP
ncbi:hypothetical protein T484DRAFT_1818952 [Baffinella frigidus]|nr:hypothetical protein T484DRAFT_1818952 [Cryptophyta sp. CCMP2293]